ncbi:MAG: hypothetical protein PV362_18825 [Providencia heimbachae]|nr:hypothetical protein [Providencia heimbachae]
MQDPQSARGSVSINNLTLSSRVEISWSSLDMLFVCQKSHAFDNSVFQLTMSTSDTFSVGMLDSILEYSAV